MPARKESKGLQGKNTLPFGDATLLGHKLSQLKGVNEIHEIVVSSDDDEILGIATEYHVSAMRRPVEYADRATPFGKFVEHICSQVGGDDVLWACCTSPFVETSLYSKAIRLYWEKLGEDYDSLITVRKLKRFVLDKNGPVNYQKGLRHKDSDQLDDLLLFTNGIVIAPREKMVQWKYIWGNIPYMLEIGKKTAMDISDSFDYEVAKFLLGREEKDG